MSAALTYREPYRFSAGVLALAVHLVFFTLLYFGFRWQSQPNEEFTVEMWNNLPDADVVPKPEPAPAPPPAKIEPPPARVTAPVLPPVKADIELREKKNKKPVLKEKQAPKNEAKEKAAAKARRDAADLKALQDYERKQVAEQARVQAVKDQVRAEVGAATKVQVDRYQDMIRNKIRRKMKMVADVPESAEAVFKVTLLPDGMLMDDPVLIKSSGFPAYDDAAARAILAAEPLPVPDDATLQKMFRKLELKIRP